MKDILQDIIANKRIESRPAKQAVQLRTLLALGGERLERTTYSMRGLAGCIFFGYHRRV